MTLFKKISILLILLKSILCEYDILTERSIKISDFLDL